jgi:hypothetical protein
LQALSAFFISLWSSVENIVENFPRPAALTLRVIAMAPTQNRCLSPSGSGFNFLP